jgi:hypothetical protein
MLGKRLVVEHHTARLDRFLAGDVEDYVTFHREETISQSSAVEVIKSPGVYKIPWCI